MASGEIIPDATPHLDNVLSESSMGTETQAITISQGSLSSLLECITQLKEALQQISTHQTHPQQLLKDTQAPVSSLPELPLDEAVVREFQACLGTSYEDRCDRLLEMVKAHPAELFLQTFGKYRLSISALHVAIWKGSPALVDALLEKLEAKCGATDPNLAGHEFIPEVDGDGLSALDMAFLIGNREILSCFRKGFGIPGDDDFGGSPTSEDEKRALLEEASPLLDKPAPASSDGSPISMREWLRGKGVDFVYCLRNDDMYWSKLEDGLNFFNRTDDALEFWILVRDNGDSSFLKPLLGVRDSLGKSPLHISGYYGYYHLYLLTELAAHFPDLDWNLPDFAGRTPLHWAAAQGREDLVTFLLRQEKIDLNATYERLGDGSEPWSRFMQESSKNQFTYGQVKGVTPLHLAVIHNHVEVVEVLLGAQGLDVNAVCHRNGRWNPYTPFQLAASMGHERILHVLLKDPRVYDQGLNNGKGTRPADYFPVPALHRAASQFHLSAVKALVDCGKVDVLATDLITGNTALHSATAGAHGEKQVHHSLFDYVTISHFYSEPPQSRKPTDQDIITCLDILMQSGLDMEQRNDFGGVPTLSPSCPEPVQIWWLQKMAKEAQEKKNNLITAANAVSVTAALVATASFVGPLQPPLGMLNDGSQTWLEGYSQVKHTSVEVFLFCDSLSFYFAIAVIVFAMLPSWPLPHEALRQEVRIARRCVQVAVFLLFGSIVFVVCAFSAASIAIVPYQRWRYKTLAVISTSVGTVVCFSILLLSFMRLLTLISSKNELARRMSNAATRIMMWERDTSSSTR